MLYIFVSIYVFMTFKHMFSLNKKKKKKKKVFMGFVFLMTIFTENTRLHPNLSVGETFLCKKKMWFGVFT